MLKGQMMDQPLLVSRLIDYGAEVHGPGTITTSTVEGGLHRYTYAQSRPRIARLANALLKLGVKPGDRVATLAWNTYRHFELYYAISGIGAVCHTINPRLSPDQMGYIVNHAQDKILFFDLTFAPLIAKLAPAFRPVTTYVAMTDGAHMPSPMPVERLKCYEDLLETGDPEIDWPEMDEHAACALCYTSGTTGDPKGSLYSNRSTLLHTLFTISCVSSPFGVNKPVLPVVPLFHANAWGLPYAAVVTGTPIVFPGPRLDGASLFDLMESENVYSSWGVPTVWLGLIAEMKTRGRKPRNLKEVIVGGSAPPPAMIETFERDFSVSVLHGWGMTEMSPIGAFTPQRANDPSLSIEQRVKTKSIQGQRMFGVDMKIVDEDGKRLPHDGVASGELHVRGNAVVSGYFNNEAASAAAIDKDGWFATGDVARISPNGFLSIVDRTKDMVKSGGEWISSIDVENVAISCPGVANAAVIGIPHPKWTERPLLVVVKAPGSDVTKEKILAHVAKKLATWQIPDDIIFADSLPLTATGKVSKRELRSTYGSHLLPGQD
jgi:fatty-acyl-CoA synthase